MTTESSLEFKRIKKEQKRLVDIGLLYHEVSLAGNSERYRRGETSHTIHVWWARRPHSAMRSLTYATVCKDLSQESLELMSKLSMPCNNEMNIEKARKLVLKGYANTPKVLDMFGGGGTIPYEALNLGLDSYSIDSNELSVFIQKANLQYLNGIQHDILTDTLCSSGEKILKNLKHLTSPIFPNRYRNDGKETTNYLWTYSYPCSNCKGYFSLTKRYWISRKKNKNLFIKVKENMTGPEFNIQKGKIVPKQTNWMKNLNKVKCPHCKHENSNISIKKAQEVITIEVVKSKNGKCFLVGSQINHKTFQYMKELENSLLKDLKSSLPKSKLPKWSGIVNPALYGVETHADIFNLRQTICCLALLKVLKDEYDYLLKKKGEPFAKYVISVLSSLIDQLVDWNCRMSMWIPQNEQVGRAFCGPGISMYWDFNETDPVANGPSNLNAKLKRIVQGVKSIKNLSNKVYVQHATAQDLPFKNETFDAIVTDPPYYDNIFYTVLADNFYAWKRILLKHIDPILFQNENTNYSHELVASTKRTGSNSEAHLKYCQDLNKAVNEAARVLKKNGTMSFIYSHSSILGWQAMIRAFRKSPMFLTSVQPLSIERKQRPRAMKSDAVNTCIAFIAKRSSQLKKISNLNNIMNSFDKVIQSSFINSLKEAGWCDDDITVGLMAQGVALVSNVKYLEDADDILVLLKLENRIKIEFPKFKLAKRKPL